MSHLKFADGTKTALTIRLVPFGGSINGRDSAGEYFSAKTNLCLEWFPDRRPLLYHHGLDKDAGVTPVGYIESIEVKADGAWARAQLDAHNEYYSEIVGLIDQEVLGASSGAMGHLVKKNKKTGHIDQWPLVEGSLTPTPCEPVLATVDFDTAKAHFKAIGVELPEDGHDGLKAVWSQAMQDKLPDSAFLYVEAGEQDGDGKTTPRSKRHFPVRGTDGALDEAHVRNALARIPQSTLPQAVKDKALAKARKYARSLGIDAAGDATKAVDLSGVCAPCLADDEAACLCAACLDGDPAGCLCDLGTYGADDAAQEPPAAPPAALSLDGCYEDVIEDLRHALNQRGPMAEYGWTELLGTFPGYVLACRHEYSDDGPGDQTYWRIPYSTAAAGDPALDLTRAEQLAQVYLPADTKSAPASLTLDAHSLGQHAAALVARTQDLHQRRIKEGRVLSAANVRILAQTVDALDTAATSIRDLLDATHRTGEEAAKAAYLASPDGRARLLALLDL